MGAVAALGSSAYAATPEQGTLSSSEPRFSWSGSVTASWGPRNVANTTGDDSVPCEQPYCDSVVLKVADGGKYLIAGADAPQDGDQVTIRVHLPNGDIVVADGDAGPGSPFTVQVDDAAKGDYAVDYMTYYVDGPVQFAGFASLGVPLFATEGGDSTSGSGSTQQEGQQQQQSPPPSSEQAPANPASAPPAAPAPAPVRAIALTAKAPKLSARRLRRSKGFTVPVTVSRGVASITATLTKGRRVMGAGRAGATARAAKLRVKLRKRLKAGRYQLTLVADDGAGTRTVKTLKVRVRR